MIEKTQVPKIIEDEAIGIPAKDRAAWQKPVLTRLAANEAEVFYATHIDGPATFS